MTDQESQPKARGMNGGRKTNLIAIDNFFRKRETGLKYEAISRLTGQPISTLEGYQRDFAKDADGNIIRKPKNNPRSQS